MALKPRHKRRIFWTLICTIGAFALAVIIIPPMITLNKFRPIIERSIYDQMAVPAKLNGDIHFSLIGGATIVAHDVVVPTARIGSVMLSVPFHDLFDMEHAHLKNAVIIYDADIKIDKLSPMNLNHTIEIYNSNIEFMGLKFRIIRAEFSNGEFHGIIRTSEQKYDIEFIGDTFNIKNKNNNLDITGQIYSDGTIRGHLSIETANINSWFGFDAPKTDQPIKLTANFEWDGGNGYKLTNINTDNVSGNIDVLPTGEKNIQLVSDNTDYDFSFLITPGKLINKTNLNLDFYGNLTFANHKFNHLRIQATGTSDKLQIANIVADDIAITGGTITANGADNIMITMPINGTNSMCLFSGTPTNWTCSMFTYGDLSGHLSVDGDKFNISVQSSNPMPTDDTFIKMIKKLGTSGRIDFQFSDIGGTYEINGDKTHAEYNFAKNKTLAFMGAHIPFLPDFMKDAYGDFAWRGGMLTFTPYDGTWQLSQYDNYFHLSGHSFKAWLPNIDLQSINDSEYTVSGFYQDGQISNLTIKINDHEFTGSASNNSITLHTPQLSIDAFKNRAFIDNYAELEFRTNKPLLVLFGIPANIALSAERLIYNGNEYNNFVYSLKPNAQTFSIMDASRGNMLTTIERDKINYEIFAQLNRFVINGYLLSDNMPLNIRDTTITGQIEMTTSGQIAHDIYYNLRGTLDLTFDGGYLSGLGIDGFYASAENITSLNAEYALSRALSGGETALKQIQIIGDYEHGNFITTAPTTIAMRHTTGIGGFAITDGYMTAEFDLTLRGTAPTPATIQLSIIPDGMREYSLSDIMRQVDPGFMRAFVKTHNKF